LRKAKLITLCPIIELNILGKLIADEIIELKVMSLKKFSGMFLIQVRFGLSLNITIIFSSSF